MLNRIANVVTFLTFSLLALILWLGAVAIHDFNTYNEQVFVHEITFYEDFQSKDDHTVGYRVEYTKCGPGLDRIPYQDDMRFTEGKISWKAPVYRLIEVAPDSSSIRHHPISIEMADQMGLTNRQDFLSYNGDILSPLRGTRVCYVNPAGVWKATRSLLSSLT